MKWAWVRCGTEPSFSKEASSSTHDFDTDQREPTRDMSVVDPVALVDDEGLEWALDDDPPVRPPSLANSPLFIPMCVRPIRGFLQNQVLTHSEVPDPSPFAFCTKAQVPVSPFRSWAMEEVIRRFRTLAIEINQTSGAHVRRQRVLVRNDFPPPRKSTIDTSVSTAVDSLRSILPIRSKRSSEYIRRRNRA